MHPLQASCEKITLCDNILAAGTRTIITRLTFEGFVTIWSARPGKLEKIPSRFVGGPSNCNTGFLVLLTEPFASSRAAHKRSCPIRFHRQLEALYHPSR